MLDKVISEGIRHDNLRVRAVSVWDARERRADCLLLSVNGQAISRRDIRIGQKPFKWSPNVRCGCLTLNYQVGVLNSFVSLYFFNHLRIRRGRGSRRCAAECEVRGQVKECL
jgi:hypothetical protein